MRHLVNTQRRCSSSMTQRRCAPCAVPTALDARYIVRECGHHHRPTSVANRGCTQRGSARRWTNMGRTGKRKRNTRLTMVAFFYVQNLSERLRKATANVTVGRRVALGQAAPLWHCWRDGEKRTSDGRANRIRVEKTFTAPRTLKYEKRSPHTVLLAVEISEGLKSQHASGAESLSLL